MKMFVNMIWSGCLLGAIAGFLVGFVVILSDATLDEAFGLVAVSVIFGGSFGALYGGCSGFASGFVMALVTMLAYREIHNTKRFQIVMGIITAVMTSAVFMFGGLWAFGEGIELAWTSAMVMSVVIATYASQIVARKYIRDVNIRKKKVDG
jgi:hypothetical protein